jgi:hypothetical protein
MEKYEMRYTYEYIFEYFKLRGYLLLDQKHKNTKDRITIVDDDGYKYHIAFDSFLWGEKKSNFIYKPEKFSKRNKYTYYNIEIYIEKNIDKFCLSDGEYISSQTKSLICCCNKNNHFWHTNLDAILRGSGCPYCDGKISSYENNLLNSFPEIIEEWDYEKNKLSPKEYTEYSGKKVFWKCKNGHSWESTIANRTFIGNGCPICSESRGEKRIRKFLINNNIDFIPQKSFDDLKGLDLGILRFDFCTYDNDKNIFALIEFQGEQHFHPIDYFGGEDKFFKNCCHDAFKRYYCSHKKINLIEINYKNLRNIKKILEKELSPLLERRLN